MLTDYRNWLESELKLLGNASHHAYSFGQANMAKRAIERLDEEFAGALPITLERTEAADILTALEMIAERDTSLAPPLEALRERLRVAIAATTRTTG